MKPSEVPYGSPLMDQLIQLADHLDARASKVLEELFYVPGFKAPQYAEQYLKLVTASEKIRAVVQPELQVNVPDEEL